MIFSMHEGSTKLRELWASSKLGFKIAVVVSLLWVAVHTIGFAYAAINPNSDPTMTNIGVGADYNFYAQTGKILDQRGPIYDFISNPFPAFTLTNHPAFSLLSSVMVEFRPAIGETFKYHPAFALLFSWLNKLPVEAIKAIWYFLLTVGYLGGVLVWFLVFSRLQSFDWHLVGYVALVPLIAYDWIGTMAFGNVSPLLLLFNALLILSIIDRRPGWAGFLTAILLMLKFYWCFPLIVLVVFKEWRLLARIVVYSLLFYAGITLIYLAAVGDWQYGLSMLRDYAIYLSITGSRQPWRGIEARFDTGNNAIYQTILRYVGFTSWAPIVTTLIQVLLILFLLWCLWKMWQAKISRTSHPEYAFVIAGIFYIVLMFMLAELNDGMLSSIICVLLCSMTPSRRWALLYIPLAFAEIPSLIGAAIGVDWLVLPTVVPIILIGFVVLLIGSWRLMIIESPSP